MQMRNHRQFAKAFCAAATLVLWAGPLLAQTFFPESEALRPGSAIELTLSDLSDDSRTESTAGSELSAVEFSLRRLSGRFRHAWFGFGAMGEARAFEERTGFRAWALGRATLLEEVVGQVVHRFGLHAGVRGPLCDLP